jgi:hypothetical protein
MLLIIAHIHIIGSFDRAAAVRGTHSLHLGAAAMRGSHCSNNPLPVASVHEKKGADTAGLRDLCAKEGASVEELKTEVFLQVTELCRDGGRTPEPIYIYLKRSWTSYIPA